MSGQPRRPKPHDLRELKSEREFEEDVHRALAGSTRPIKGRSIQALYMCPDCFRLVWGRGRPIPGDPSWKPGPIRIPRGANKKAVRMLLSRSVVASRSGKWCAVHRADERRRQTRLRTQRWRERRRPRKFDLAGHTRRPHSYRQFACWFCGGPVKVLRNGVSLCTNPICRMPQNPPARTWEPVLPESE